MNQREIYAIESVSVYERGRNLWSDHIRVFLRWRSSDGGGPCSKGAIKPEIGR